MFNLHSRKITSRKTGALLHSKISIFFNIGSDIAVNVRLVSKPDRQ